MTETEPKTNFSVKLDTPIIRDKTKVTEITLRRPKAGELRGLSMADLARLDVSAMLTLIPRISSPTINREELEDLPTEDMFALATEVGSFLLQKADLTGFPAR